MFGNLIHGLMPCMKFLSVGPDVCRRLPSDSTSRWTPLPLAIAFPLLGRLRDLHPLDNAHAERTEKRAPQRPLSSFALQRYNITRRKANRRRRTQNGKIRKKGKWRRVVVPCPLTWHSVLVAAPAATPFLCRRNAAVPRVARQWVRPRSSAMSIDVALRTSSWCPATIPFL